jgi:hypothetical protein
MHGATGAERGSGVQQQFQPRQTDGGSSLLKREVVQREWDDDNEVLEVHGDRRREGVVGNVGPA